MKSIDEQKTTDEVICAVRAIKESLARSMDFDIDRILADARQKQQQSGRTILSPEDRHHRA